MGDDTHSPSVLVISNDYELLDQLKKRNNSGQEFKGRNSIQQALEDAELLLGNSIVIIDISVNHNDIESTVEQVLNLKQHDPTQVLILVGDADPLGLILKTQIQPIIYRAFNKPIHPSQIFLAFNNANKVHNRLVKQLAAGKDLGIVGLNDKKNNIKGPATQRKNMPLLYGVVALLAVGIFTWLLLGGNAENANVTIESAPTPSIESVEMVETEADQKTPEPNIEQMVAELNTKAARAFSEGKLIAPAGDNALALYQQALTLDPYDPTAYKGKKSIADGLRDSYHVLVKQAQFDHALGAINSLQKIEPLNLQNDELHANLEAAINKHVRRVQSRGTAKEIAETSAILNKMEASFGGSQSAAAALKKEQRLIVQIDSAIRAGNLIPPQKNNAYALVSSALKNNTISKAHSTPRVRELGGKLIQTAKERLTLEDLDEAEKLAALVKRLGGNPNALANLNKAITSKKDSLEKALAEERLKREELAKIAAEKPVAPVITPAVAISQQPPRYPKRALDRNITGWVSLSFIVGVNGEPYSIQVVSAEPTGTFDEAAIRAIKKWRFEPAINESTGLPVESKIDSTKVNFQITDD